MAPSSPERLFQRRLGRLKGDSSYGPMFKRLSKADQGRITELVGATSGRGSRKGREARELLKSLDKERRNEVRLISKGRRGAIRASKLSDEERTQDKIKELGGLNEPQSPEQLSRNARLVWDRYHRRMEALARTAETG